MIKADRDINKLHPEFKLKVELFLKEVGDKIFITEGYRSNERQLELYAQGRTTPGNIVTWTTSSKHQEGLAIDIAFKGAVLYPNDMKLWLYIGEISKKLGINWGYELWGIDKPHFEDNGKPYIPKVEKMVEEEKTIIKQYGKLVTKNGFTFPESVYGIPIRFVVGEFTGLAKVKGYAPGVIKDEILITKYALSKGEDHLYKVLMHEFSHFIYHRHLDTKIDDLQIFNDGKSFWEDFSLNCKTEYITEYASTQPAEDFAECIGYSHYIKNKKQLPDKCKFNDVVKFKYEVAIKLYVNGLHKFLGDV